MPPAPITLCGERGGDNEAADERRGLEGAALTWDRCVLDTTHLTMAHPHVGRERD